MKTITPAILIAATAMLACCAAPSSPGSPPDGGAWTLLGSTPAPRAGHTAVYDAKRDRMLVFGGGTNDLWAQALSGKGAGSWTRIDAGGDVPPPIGTVAVIDEGKDRLLVFPDTSLERAWELPLDGKGQWSLVGFGQAPQIVLSFALAADPAGRRLFAYTSGTPEVWELPLDGDGTWTRLAGPPDPEGFSCRDDLVFDRANGRLLVLSGGWPRGNVYALSLSATPAWTKLNTQDTWFDYGSSSIYDAKAGRFLVAGPSNIGWVWSFQVGDPAGQWTHLPVGGTSPGTRWGASSVYDSAHDRMVVFGGQDSVGSGAVHDDTWAVSLDGSPQWSQLGALDTSMPTDQRAALAFAPETESVLRFGGFQYDVPSSSQRFDDQSGTWKPIGDTPSDMLGWAAGAWDPVGHRALAFGSYDATAAGQTWSLDMNGAVWTQLDASGAQPETRVQHSMVHDAGGGQMLVFGGQDSGYPYMNYFDDVWAFSLQGNAWSKLSPQGKGPAGRSSHAAAFDDASRRMLVFGGTGKYGVLSDAWLLDLSSSPRWIALHPKGDAPAQLDTPFAAFDTASGRFIVAGTPEVSPPATPDGAAVWALSADGKEWTRYCPKGLRPATVDGLVSTDRGIFVTSKGSSWRFDPETPACE